MATKGWGRFRMCKHPSILAETLPTDADGKSEMSSNSIPSPDVYRDARAGRAGDNAIGLKTSGGKDRSGRMGPSCGKKREAGSRLSSWCSRSDSRRGL